MKYVTSYRRQIVMATMLGLALVGGAMRYWAPNPSVTRDIGTLMLVLWLPAVGNLVSFVVRQFHKRRS
jgi:TRAP-type C4-dicarboxylate transport system permease small subunit